ncbi:MAG: hypothetical protein ACI87C_001818 [Paraperlucidibaca sp.]|jgi:hypothetical protein
MVNAESMSKVAKSLMVRTKWHGFAEKLSG